MMNLELSNFNIDDKKYSFYKVSELSNNVSNLPYSLVVLLESIVRQIDNVSILPEHAKNLANWGTSQFDIEIPVPFKPSRILLQDFTGVPVVVDLASLRKAISENGGNPEIISPEIPVDLVIDHSLQVDKYGTKESMNENTLLEFQRNEERYRFLKWAQKSFDNFRVVPPATGIVHQVNIEFLADVVSEKDLLVFPDTVLGTDSHTTMVNALGVLGWGVGGIEAEAAMLGEASFFPVPEVIGVELIGSLCGNANATDLVLHITKALREKGVVGKFVEFFGEGMERLSIFDRATVANMAPEYGATCGYFPIDDETLNYLKITGRSADKINLIKAYCTRVGLFYDGKRRKYSDTLIVDLGKVETSLAGPKRPQDLIPLVKMKSDYRKLSIERKSIPVNIGADKVTLKNGDVVIAAITSCTNTSNPYAMIGAGLLAKKAVERGMKVPKHVKTSLAPGSKVVTKYLESAGLLPYLEQLGFHIVGYGCTTCIGNSGPLLPEIEAAISIHDMTVASVLSGNRNFEGRISPLVKNNYLASPMLVVAYALAGNIEADFKNLPISQGVYLSDIWPTEIEIDLVIANVIKSADFEACYQDVFDGNSKWNNIGTGKSTLYKWDERSTYIQNPPYFDGVQEANELENLKVLAFFGDSVTTDHISPAGKIGDTSPAASYLKMNGVKQENFNSYGSRRGNHKVMLRGTFANNRISNKLASGKIGGVTKYHTTGEIMSIFDASIQYKKDNTGLIVIAGKDYGMGSSRDWAAKGTKLLGVKVVLAESFERIHRSNLAMMGVIPLQFIRGENAEILDLTGEEVFSINLDNHLIPMQNVTVIAENANGDEKQFEAILRLDSEIEIEYYRHGGILPSVLNKKMKV